MSISDVREAQGTRGRWLVGNTYDYDLDRLGFLRQCQAEFGDVFRFSPVTMVILEPELIHEIFARTNKDFYTEIPLFPGGDTAAELIGEIPSTMAARRQGWRGMNRPAAAKHGERFLRHLDALLARSAGQVTDVLPVMKDFSGAAVADFCVGGSGTDVGEITEAVDAAASLTVVAMASWLTLPRVAAGATCASRKGSHSPP